MRKQNSTYIHRHRRQGAIIPVESVGYVQCNSGNTRRVGFGFYFSTPLVIVYI
ncbi:MAG: DUF3107 family protein [Actinomyces sp.]|nr:DUF3107 family protein [Actinomyces sp.]MBS6101522.1 DUF3107 family protein [Actinomyces sp.]